MTTTAIIRCPGCDAQLASWQKHERCDTPTSRPTVVTPTSKPRQKRPKRSGPRCYMCGITDPAKFYPGTLPRGRRCKECTVEYNRRYLASHPEFAERQRERRRQSAYESYHRRSASVAATRGMPRLTGSPCPVCQRIMQVESATEYGSGVIRLHFAGLCGHSWERVYLEVTS